jgi:hypothetical protein
MAKPDTIIVDGHAFSTLYPEASRAAGDVRSVFRDDRSAWILQAAREAGTQAYPGVGTHLPDANI